MTTGKKQTQNKQKQNFFSECAKRREKELQILTTQKILRKLILSNKQNMSYDIASTEKIVFELQEIGWNLSIMSINYKTTKTAKIEKYKKSLRTNNIVNLKTIRHRLSALSKIIHSILK